MTLQVWSPLLWAVKDNNAPVLQQLIGDGHSPDEKDSKLYQVSSLLVVYSYCQVAYSR